jgi:hypothetical protein
MVEIGVAVLDEVSVASVYPSGSHRFDGLNNLSLSRCVLHFVVSTHKMYLQQIILNRRSPFRKRIEVDNHRTNNYQIKTFGLVLSLDHLSHSTIAYSTGTIYCLAPGKVKSWEVVKHE